MSCRRDSSRLSHWLIAARSTALTSPTRAGVDVGIVRLWPRRNRCTCEAFTIQEHVGQARRVDSKIHSMTKEPPLTVVSMVSLTLILGDVSRSTASTSDDPALRRTVHASRRTNNYRHHGHADIVSPIQKKPRSCQVWLQDWLWSDDSVPGLFIYSPLRMAPLKPATLKCKLLLVRNEANLADTLEGLVCSEPLPSRCDVRVGLQYEWYDDIE